MEVLAPIEITGNDSDPVVDDGKSKRANPVSPEMLELLAKSHHLHFSEYCKGRKQKPTQKIPKFVWDKIKIDIEDRLGCSLQTRQERNLKDTLRGFLDSINTGTANAEGENSKPELQNCDIMLALRDSDTMASKILQKRRFDIIQGAHSKKNKNSKLDTSQNSELHGEGSVDVDDADEIVVVTKSEHRRRSIVAIESISKSIDTGTQQAACFFFQQSERHELQKLAEKRNHDTSTLKQDLLRQSIQKQNHELLKNKLDILSFKKQHGLITESEFTTQVLPLTSSND